MSDERVNCTSSNLAKLHRMVRLRLVTWLLSLLNRPIRDIKPSTARTCLMDASCPVSTRNTSKMLIMMALGTPSARISKRVLVMDTMKVDCCVDVDGQRFSKIDNACGICRETTSCFVARDRSDEIEDISISSCRYSLRVLLTSSNIPL